MTSAKKNGIPNSAVSTSTGARRRSSRSAGEGEGEGECEEEDDGADAVETATHDAVERLAFDNLDSAVRNLLDLFTLYSIYLSNSLFLFPSYACTQHSHTYIHTTDTYIHTYAHTHTHTHTHTYIHTF